jgi:cellulose synthase/poly-beta-1,6-N-acetylglucosamine synthase-like glycosyltransferase
MPPPYLLLRDAHCLPLSILERTNITKSCKAIRPVVTQKPKGPVLSTMSFISASTLRDSVPYILPIGLIGLWRWALFAIRILFWLLYRPLYPKKNPDGTSANVYKSTDVTIIVPTIDNGKEFMEAAEIWLRNRPFEVIIVTSETMREELSRTCASIDPDLFRVLSVPKPNKRLQLMKGIHAAQTSIVALSDDDSMWTSNFLDWMLAPFDDKKMGGVGSRQEMTPVEDYPSGWEVIADFRLTMRMIETSATTFVDGGMSCLSGRTAVYRTEILQDPEFEEAFVNETWQNRYQLHSGDDKFITRWVVKKHWHMRMQNHKEASLRTTFKNNSQFLKQVIRWTRNTWRSDIRSIFVDRVIWRSHPYVAFNMIDKFINPIPVLYGCFLIISNICKYGFVDATYYVILPVGVWLIVSRLLRLLPHLIQKPTHIVYIPVMLAFQYFFIFMKIYAVFTLHVTEWGSRNLNEETGTMEADPDVRKDKCILLDISVTALEAELGYETEATESSLEEDEVRKEADPEVRKDACVLLDISATALEAELGYETDATESSREEEDACIILYRRDASVEQEQ